MQTLQNITLTGSLSHASHFPGMAAAVPFHLTATRPVHRYAHDNQIRKQRQDY